METPHIVITGNPCDGFAYHGPFADWDAASEYTETMDDSEWWIAPLHTPTE